MLVSALSGEGVAALSERTAALLTAGHRRYRIVLGAADGAGAAWLHAHGEVLERHEQEDNQLGYEVRLAERDYERFKTR